MAVNLPGSVCTSSFQTFVVSVFCLRIQDEELQEKKQEKKSKTRLEHVTRTA